MLDRLQLRRRIAEEVERSRRHGQTFGLLVFEAVPGAEGPPLRARVRAAGGAIEAVVRASDVIGWPYEDMLVVVVIETDAAGTRDAMLRIRSRIAGSAGAWRVMALSFPEQARTIAEMSFLDAA